MSRALDLARDGLGRTAPNPAVGCVIVRDGRITGEGRTADGGRPHAEAVALGLAGGAAQGADIYVSLEPCFHTDRPSCASRLIESGVRRVVIGCLDENPAIRGHGVAALKAAGIEVEAGLLEDECRQLNRGFFLAKTQSRPLVTLKTAISLDAKIATSAGESRWITGAESRAFVHRLRASHDAILTGIGTVLADDPELTSRTGDRPHRSVRVILDSCLRLRPDARIMKTKDAGDIVVFASENADPDRLEILRAAGADVVPASRDADGGLALPPVLQSLAARGITRLMVEAGQGVLTSFLRAGLWDDLYIMRAPVVIGRDGRDAFGPLGLAKLNDAIRPRLAERFECGTDLCELYRRT